MMIMFKIEYFVVYSSLSHASTQSTDLCILDSHVNSDRMHECMYVVIYVVYLLEFITV